MFPVRAHFGVDSSRFQEAAAAYQNAIKLDALNISALTSLGMLAQECDDIKTAVERYHQALAIETTNPIATFLLERALKEQVDFGSHRFDGLPAALTDPTLNPFKSEDIQGHPLAQNRLLQLPPFPNFGKLEAEEQRSRQQQAAGIQAEDSDESLAVEETTMDEATMDETRMDGSAVHDTDAGDGTAMSVSMSVSMDDVDESRTAGGDSLGEGSTMDLE